MRIVMVGPFGLSPRMTMRARAFQLARHLVARGHAVRMVMPPLHTPELAGRRWTEDGVEIQYVSLSPSVPALSGICTTRRLVHSALAHQPDVVHVFKPIGHAGVAAGWLHLRNGLATRKLALIIDEDDWEGRGGWSEVLPHTRAARTLIASQETWALGHATVVTVASRELESLAWSRGRHSADVHHLPNGPREWPEGDGAVVRERHGLGQAPVVLLYTRFFEYDVTRVAEAYRIIHDARPDCRLLVVGQGLNPEDERRFYDALASMGLGSAATCAGLVPERDLPDYFAAADVALYPFDDNLINRTKCPVKLTDLLYSGVPVVAESIGEIREYLRHRESGLLVGTGDPHRLADAALELLEKPDYARSLAAAATLEMRTRFAWAARAEQLVKIYEQACRQATTYNRDSMTD